jgi:competence CoiA-like predicted nuclease
MDMQTETSIQYDHAGRSHADIGSARLGGFNPDEIARVTQQNSISFVTRVSDQATFEVANWLPSFTLGEIHTLRPEIRTAGVRQEYPFVCSACGEAVVLKAYTDHGHFFSHLEKQRAEEAGCPFREHRQLTQDDLDRMRYHGQREGARHKRIKELIARTLMADTRFAKPEIEQTWKCFVQGWRRPDVSSQWNGISVVFEAQVSNTYPQVVAERTEFYRRDGVLLIWIFDRQPDEHWRTMHADSFCTNQQHLFVVDEESASESERLGRACLRTYMLRPDVQVRNSDSGKHLLEEFQAESYGLVPFESLALNVERQTACLFDVVTEKRRSHHKVLCADVHAGLNADALSKDIQDIMKSDRDIEYKKLEAWAALVCAIESVRFGCGIGTRYTNPVQVLNQVFDHHPNVVGLLDAELARQNLDHERFHDGAWGKRSSMIRNGRYNDSKLSAQHPGSMKMLKWLYARS